jgi:hypothetical protein
MALTPAPEMVMWPVVTSIVASAAALSSPTPTVVETVTV